VRSQVARTTALLQKDAVLSYVFDSVDVGAIGIFTQNQNQVDARSVYNAQVIGDITAVEANLSREQQTLQSVQRNQHEQRDQVAQATNEAALLVSQNNAVEAATSHELATMNTTLKHLVELAAVAAARKAAAEEAARQSAAEAAAAAGAVAVAGETGGSSGIIAALHGSGGSISGSASGTSAGEAAFAAAQTQIGVPYVWGGESPGQGFDCSGLTQWAWAQAGVSIPRTAAEQWYALPHVSLSQLQPGDLLFYYNLDGDNTIDHVVMYGGSGPFGADTTIAAAYTGTDISLYPAFTSGLIGAARP
jgi:cell wall-associated NlpC family hydrolase